MALLVGMTGPLGLHLTLKRHRALPLRSVTSLLGGFPSAFAAPASVLTIPRGQPQ
jgi:hypothetical protein